MDGREWDDEAETPVVCVGVSFFFGGDCPKTKMNVHRN